MTLAWERPLARLTCHSPCPDSSSFRGIAGSWLALAAPTRRLFSLARWRASGPRRHCSRTSEWPWTGPSRRPDFALSSSPLPTSITAGTAPCGGGWGSLIAAGGVPLFPQPNSFPPTGLLFVFLHETRELVVV